MRSIVRQYLILQFYNHEWYDETVFHFYNFITMNGTMRQ